MTIDGQEQENKEKNDERTKIMVEERKSDERRSKEDGIDNGVGM
jgi:hypothetical protein